MHKTFQEWRGESERESATIEETPGLKAEKIVVEFLQEAFPNLIIRIEKTSTFDQNDRNGIDFLCELSGGGKLAVDVTFNNDERRKLKMERAAKNPLATFRDDQGRPIERDVPRVLLYERSMALWLDYEEKAEVAGLNLISIMGPKDIKEQEIRFLETVMDQLKGLSGRNSAYGEKAEPIKKIFEQELGQFKAAA